MYDEGGRLRGFSKVARDITERKRFEDELRETQARMTGIIASAMDSIITVDHQQCIVLFNLAAEKMFRCPAAEAIGNSIERFIPQRFRSGHSAHIRKFGETGVTGRAMGTLGALWAVRADGEEFQIEASISQIESGGKRLFTVILRDVTERKRAEQQLAGQAEELSRQAAALLRSQQEVTALNSELEHRVVERTAQLEAANQELEGFTYSVSHDLRAPLRHIGGFSKILVEEFGGTLPAEAQNHLERIQEGSRRMGMLVDGLLGLARLGRQAMSTQDTAVGEVVKDLVKMLESEGGPEQTVEWRIGNLPVVECDPVLIRQVFQNLISNALKYSRPREQAVIEIGAIDQQGERVFFVRDNGVGFNMKYADKLFGVFQRLHRPEEFEGTGVGLATAQRIVQRHGGRIWAEAEVDKGATFYFTLGGGEARKARSAEKQNEENRAKSAGQGA
jgi:PAS domain S-box-containing protein